MMMSSEKEYQREQILLWFRQSRKGSEVVGSAQLWPIGMRGPRLSCICRQTCASGSTSECILHSLACH